LVGGWNDIRTPFYSSSNLSEAVVYKGTAEASVEEAVEAHWIADVLFQYVDGVWHTFDIRSAIIEPGSYYWVYVLADNLTIRLLASDTTVDDLLNEQATRDMLGLAAGDSRFGFALEETLGIDLNWHENWELRWMAFTFTGDRVVWIYHATCKWDTTLRLINFLDPDTDEWTGFNIVDSLEILLPPTAITVDIKPQSCPNPVNIDSNGVLPVAILGTDSLDVTEINAEAVRMYGEYPVGYAYEDVGTPVTSENVVPDAGGCECTEEGSDGRLDLVLRFDLQGVVEAVGGRDALLSLVGEYVEAEIAAEAFDGRRLSGSDCVRIQASQGRGNGK